LNRLRDLGGNWHAAAALLEQSMHALFAGQPPEPMVETPHEDGPVTPQPANLAYRPQPANLAYRPQPANLAYRPELGGVAGPAGDPTPP
jgi:hypothetical protein